MKRKYFFLFTLFTLIFPTTSFALDKASVIESVYIDIWPDYDKASVLVLLTGTLPAAAKLPASVTLPFPENAQLNALARIDPLDGKMKDDVLSTPGPGEITFTIPDLRFRLEYYIPYEVINDKHAFDFTWSAKIAVDRLLLRVQQPNSATSFITEPAIVNPSKGEDGLFYYTFPSKTIPAGQSFLIHVEYILNSPQLSIASLTHSQTAKQKPEIPSSRLKTKSGINWVIVVAGAAVFIIVIIFVWLMATRQATANQPKTRPVNSKKHISTKFCSHCGHSIGTGDKFCIKCGKALIVD